VGEQHGVVPGGDALGDPFGVREQSPGRGEHVDHRAVVCGDLSEALAEVAELDGQDTVPGPQNGGGDGLQAPCPRAGQGQHSAVGAEEHAQPGRDAAKEVAEPGGTVADHPGGHGRERALRHLDGAGHPVVAHVVPHFPLLSARKMVSSPPVPGAVRVAPVCPGHPVGGHAFRHESVERRVLRYGVRAGGPPDEQRTQHPGQVRALDVSLEESPQGADRLPHRRRAARVGHPLRFRRLHEGREPGQIERARQPVGDAEVCGQGVGHRVGGRGPGNVNGLPRQGGGPAEGLALCRARQLVGVPQYGQERVGELALRFRAPSRLGGLRDVVDLES
jgi:hypothetical protein